MDPKINQLLSLDLNHDTPISHSDDFYIDFSGDSTIVFPDKDTVLKTSYEDVTWSAANSSFDIIATKPELAALEQKIEELQKKIDKLIGPCYCESLL